MPGEIDLNALNEATSDMMGMLSGDRKVERKVQAQVDAEAEAAREAAMTDEERAARAEVQRLHAEKVRRQRAETEAAEAAAEAERKAQAAAFVPGTMGIGRVPVDVGRVSGAFEYELEFGEVFVYVPLPEGVGAKQLRVEVGARSLSVGLKGKPPYLKGTLRGPVHPDDVVWTIEGRTLKVELTKATKEIKANEEWHGCLELPDGWACDWSLA